MKRRDKPQYQPTQKRRSGRLTLTLTLAFSLPFAAHANPTGPTLVSGSALISNPSANVMQVVNTPGTIIDWNAFSIADGETTRFVQLNSASAVLNRVTGGSPSSILGRLESNGRVFLINSNGIVFGGSSVVNVAGLIASTRNITNDNFTSGNYSFSGTGEANIIVEGNARIQTSGNGGQVWLFANKVNTRDGSQIETPQGQVVIAAASSVTVGTSDLGAMSFHVQTDSENTISAMGEIIAQRGAVGFFADAINFGGKVSARAADAGQGSISALATSTIQVGRGAQLEVSADGAASAGSIHLEAELKISVDPGAEVLAESLAGHGGAIHLKSYQIDLPAPRQPLDSWSLFSETNQSVRAFGVDAASDGTVTIEESGFFTYTTTPVPGAATQEDFSFQSPAGFNAGCCAISIIRDAAQSGDGAVLYYNYVSGSSGSTARNDFTLVRDGNSVALGEIIQGSENSVNLGRIWGLAHEGWVVEGWPYVSIVRADGTVGATWNFGDNGFISVVPLPSGAVWLRKLAYDEVTELDSRVYTASGTELTGDARAQALGTVRAIDVARHAGASASGGAFQRREISDTGGGEVQRVLLYTHDLVQKSQVLTSLQQSSYIENPSQITADSYGATVVSVAGAAPDATVTWEKENRFDQTIGGESYSQHTPLSGFGGNGALLYTFGYSDNLSTTYHLKTTYVRRVLGEPDNYVQWVNSLNEPSDDGHFLPPYDSRTDVLTETYLRQRSYQTGLGTLRRTPLVALGPTSSVTGSVGQSAAFDTRPGLATNTDVPLLPSNPNSPTNVNVSPPALPADDSNLPPTSSTNDNDPPTVVTGTGSGASFGGISGCNSAVCADNVIRARNVIDAMRAAEAVSSINSISFIDLSLENRAALAVALSTGQQASSNNSTDNGNLSRDERAALAVIELARAANREIPTGEQALGVAQLMRNNGELRRLINGSVFFPDQTPRQRWEAAQQWLRAEQAEQATGSGGNTTVVEEVTLVHLLANMTTEAEVDSFYRETILPMQLGQ